jgi:hypothetical protein
MIFLLKIKLNHGWKFQKNWNVPSVSLERSWREDLIKFIWSDLDSECGRYWVSFNTYLHNTGSYLSSSKGTKYIIEILRDNHNWVEMQRGGGCGVRGKVRGFTLWPRWNPSD